MNHCILEVEAKQAPTLRYTQDNKTPISEITVQFDGLRPDDPPSELKLVGWGNMAENLQTRVQPGQRLVVEGRLRMNMVPRQDGTKEKRAELTLSRLHVLSQASTHKNNERTLSKDSQLPSSGINSKDVPEKQQVTEQTKEADTVSWNSSPLVPDTDDIPF